MFEILFFLESFLKFEEISIKLLFIIIIQHIYTGLLRQAQESLLSM